MGGVGGEDDVRTPTENARQTAQLFPRSRIVVAPATGHSAISSDFSRCAERAFARFVQQRPVRVSCTPVRRDFAPTPPPPARLADVPLPGGAHGISGRTLGAVLYTLSDAATDLFTQAFTSGDLGNLGGGGLRSGGSIGTAPSSCTASSSSRA